MSNKAVKFVGAAILAAVLSASCVESAPAGPLATLIPANAMAAVVVESPYKLYAAAEQFWKAAALDKTAGSDLQTLLQKSVPNASQALQVLDFARPWALAVLPTSNPKKTRQVLYVPYRSKPDDLVGKLFGSGSMQVVADAKGYIALSDSAGDLSFPPAKGADLSRLSRYPIASIKLWGDPDAIRSAIKASTFDSFKPIDEAIREFVSPPSDVAAAPATATTAAAAALEQLGFSLLAQLGLADAAIEPGPTGLVLRVGVASKAGSDFQKALTAASANPSALDYASQIGTQAMYGYAWSMDPGIVSGLYAQMLGPLFTSLGLPADIATKAAALQTKWAKAAGPRGAINLDLDIDAAAIAGAKDFKSEDPAAISDLVKKMLKIKFDMMQDVKDEASYRALIKGLSSDPDYLAFAKAYSDAFGLSIAVKSQDKKAGAFSYGELGIEVKVVDSSKLESLGSKSGGSGAASSKAAEAAIAALSNLIQARWTISNGRFVATGGDPAALQALVARKAADKNLGADPVFAAFAKTMPPKTFMVGTLSMSKLMGMVSKIAAASASAGSTPSALPDPSLFGSWFSYMAIDARASMPAAAPGIEAGFLIPASDIGAIVQASGTLFKPKPSNSGA